MSTKITRQQNTIGDAVQALRDFGNFPSSRKSRTTTSFGFGKVMRIIDGMLNRLSSNHISSCCEGIAYLAEFLTQSKALEELNQYKSTNVQKVFDIETDFKSEKDLKKYGEELIKLMRKFTKVENKEYLTKFKQLFTLIYSLMPEDFKITRMHELSDLSLREPINMTKPIRFIEFMVLARTTIPFSSMLQANSPAILDDYINEFVEKSKEPARRAKSRRSE